jgi:hypothetical protein
MNDSDPNQPVNPGQMRKKIVTIPFPESFVYSNCSALGTSLMDIHISFAEALPEDLRVVPKVGIVMPPEHAAQLAMTLLAQIMVYEQNFGYIRHPEWVAFKAANGGTVAAAQKNSIDNPPLEESSAD